MKQQTLATAADQNAGFERYRKPTRRDEFLATMNMIVPWSALCEVIAPHYPKGVGGRPPIGLERMLRIHGQQTRAHSVVGTGQRPELRSRRRSDQAPDATAGRVASDRLKRLD